MKLLLLIFAVFLVAEEWEKKVEIEETAIAVGTRLAGNDYGYYYNRLRAYIDLKQSSEAYDLSVSFIGDGVSNYDLINNKLLSKDLDIYRWFGRYEDEYNDLSVGIQKIDVGVGSIYSPLNIFSPINSTAIEISERAGLNALRYIYSIDKTSSFTYVASNDYKHLLRYKVYALGFDVGAMMIRNRVDGVDENTYGMTVEGALIADWGIDIKSEIAYHSQKVDYMVGLTYGSGENMATLEYYKTPTTENKVALSLSTAIESVWSLYLLSQYDFINDSAYAMPMVGYSINDDSSIRIGIQDSYSRVTKENTMGYFGYLSVSF